jgi:hypothetical protein
MKRLLLAGLLVAAALAAACGGDSDEGDTSPTAEPGSPSPATSMSAEEIITLVQEFPVLYKVDKPDGTFELKPSTINGRVDVLCTDDASWSAEDKQREWRVYAECKRQESATSEGTPPPYGFETLDFEWIFYPNSRHVMPVSQASHDAQYAFPQPSTIPTIAPLPTLTP